MEVFELRPGCSGLSRSGRILAKGGRVAARARGSGGGSRGSRDVGWAGGGHRTRCHGCARRVIRGTKECYKWPVGRGKVSARRGEQLGGEAAALISHRLRRPTHRHLGSPHHNRSWVARNLVGKHRGVYHPKLPHSIDAQWEADGTVCGRRRPLSRRSSTVPRRVGEVSTQQQ